jgi:hypothetical protein
MEVKMVFRKVVVSCLLAAMLASVCLGTASAHTTVTSGPYDIEIGWVNEPPIIGQMNAIVVNISDHASGAASEADVSGLTVTVSYGGQSKALTLQPLGEDTPGQYVAPILPTIPGLYTVDVTGKLADTDVKVEVQPEEVQAADTVQFPNPAASQAQGGTGFGLTGWLAVAGLVFGLAGLVVAMLAWRKTG